jgi:hypothetical protein
MTPVLQLALLYLDHPDLGTGQLFYRTVSELSGGFFNVGATITDNQRFLENFAEEMAGYPVHPQRHPPGLPLLFGWAGQFFAGQPAVANAISAWLRPYQCHNLSLMNLPNSAIAAALVQMLLPLWLGIIVLPLYYFGRLAYGQVTGQRAALLWPLLPSVGLWATRWNQLYALFTLLAFICLHLGLSRRRQLFFVLSGLIVALATFYSFGNGVITGFLGLYAIAWVAGSDERPRWGWLAGSALLFCLGLAGWWLAMEWLYRLNVLNIWKVAMGTHLSLGRDYLTWLFYHLYDFWVFLGIPLALFSLARIGQALWRWQQRPLDVLALSFAAGLLLLDLSGSSQGEVARVWSFLMPLALLTAVPRQTDSQAANITTGIAILLAGQLLISNVFLQPVSTGLSDPPLPPASDQRVTTNREQVARWVGGPLLYRVDAPQTAVPGQDITVTAHWGTDQPLSRAYTVFVHLLNQQGTLISQVDEMPVDGRWPTTCWQPGRAFQDQYTLELPADSGPGVYLLQMGLYWLPDGERVALLRPEEPDRSFKIGQVLIEATPGE